jgi:hypothetical protein
MGCARVVRPWLLAGITWLAATTGAATAHAQDPFADRIVSFTPGTNAGFGQDELPGIVLGPPFGAGNAQGSLHTLSLGNGGEVVMGFDAPVICDGDGVDFTVFENAFRAAGGTGPVFVEAGIVAVSQDGDAFFEFPYDAETYEGLAGKTPVFSTPVNGIDPTDPAVSGGDSFDLATVGLDWAAYVRITDPGAAIPDPGNLIPPGINAGFDLDAIAAIHPCFPTPTETPTPTASLLLTPTPSPTAAPSPSATAEPTATPSAAPSSTSTASPTLTLTAPTASATATVEPTATQLPFLRGDADGSGAVDPADLAQLIGELFDGDGDDAAGIDGGEVVSFPGADASGDGRISAADLVETVRRQPR